ncbi:MAG: hypothetical protein LBC61_00275 [Candidatus Peribacteria bacterium]|nr:hypothetical protein [Candidatus Peribacteria bacterium]
MSNVLTVTVQTFIYNFVSHSFNPVTSISLFPSVKLNIFVGNKLIVSLFTINVIHQGIFHTNGLCFFLSVIVKSIISLPHTVIFQTALLNFKSIL